MRTCVLAVLLVGCASQSREPSPAPDPGVDLVAIEFQLKAALRRLVVAQEIYYSERATYAPDLFTLLEMAEMRVDSSGGVRFSPDPAVFIAIVAADQTGWSATASHEHAPSVGCGVFVGSAASPLEGVVTMGQPECPRP